MVTVKLFGLLRLDTGIKELSVEAKSIRALYPILLEEAKRRNPDSDIKKSDIDECIFMVNGVQKNKHAKLKDGDTVTLMSAVSGG
ncbi:MAG: MoaD/ThiS family protein [Lachnospiraceae bacterium]|nr:MoaD/ThiS family protein [Lachnospiraceae bacterium]